MINLRRSLKLTLKGVTLELVEYCRVSKFAMRGLHPVRKRRTERSWRGLSFFQIDSCLFALSLNNNSLRCQWKTTVGAFTKIGSHVYIYSTTFENNAITRVKRYLVYKNATRWKQNNKYSPSTPYPTIRTPWFILCGSHCRLVGCSTPLQ